MLTFGLFAQVEKRPLLTSYQLDQQIREKAYLFQGRVFFRFSAAESDIEKC